MTPEQRQFLSSLLENLGPQAEETLSSLLGGNQMGFEDQFQQGVVDPTLQAYNEQVLPALEQRYADIGAGSSSALNQALIKSSEDVTKLLASQRIPYQQGQQNLVQQGQMGALSGILGLLGQKAYAPIVQGPQEGLLKDLIGAGSNIGAAAISAGALSSKEIKKNIREYEKGLDVVRDLDVKQYDYTIPVEGRQNDRVGLIAEDVPSEIQAQIGSIKGIDVYGLVSLLVNAVKQLDMKVKALEAR